MFNSSVNKFLFNLAKQKPIYIFSSLIIELASSIFNGLGTVLLIPILITLLGDRRQIYLPNQLPIIKHFIAFFEHFEGEKKLLIMITLVILAIILKNLANYLGNIIEIKYTKYLVYQMKTRGFALLCKVDLEYYQKSKVGDILFKLNREIDKTALAIKNGQKIFNISIIIVTFSSLLLLISWKLTFVSIVLLLWTSFINKLIIDHCKKLEITLSKKSKLYSRKVVDFLTGIYLIKTVANEAEEYQEITRLIREKDQAQFNAQSISAMISPINEIAGLTIILALITASIYLYPQEIQEWASVLLIYLVILFKLLPFIPQLNNARIQFANNIPSAEIVANFLDEANKPIIKSGTITFSKLKSGIEFQRVTFAYPNHAQIVLDKINIWIPQGKTIALVGSSGAGKSTIADLLPRFYDPIEGNILIDGKDLKEYELVSFRKSIALVSQDAFLFNNSIAYNIAYGLKNVSKAEIITSAKRANAYEFINQLPEGFSTKIGERGVELSRGQRERIAIARAFLRDPDILILDEVGSASDPVSQKLVQEAIEELCRNRTTLIIANRLSTIQKVHQIIVLNKGKIVEAGTHEELLKQGNFYNRLYSMQFKTSQQSRQQKLAQKISQKLARQTNSNLSSEIRNNLNSLLNYLQLVNEGLVGDSQEQEKILDESYQSAKNMLASLREYERKISRRFLNPNS